MKSGWGDAPPTVQQPSGQCATAGIIQRFMAAPFLVYFVLYTACQESQQNEKLIIKSKYVSILNQKGVRRGKLQEWLLRMGTDRLFFDADFSQRSDNPNLACLRLFGMVVRPLFHFFLHIRAPVGFCSLELLQFPRMLFRYALGIFAQSPQLFEVK